MAIEARKLLVSFQEMYKMQQDHLAELEAEEARQ
jgi:hypothetical protein